MDDRSPSDSSTTAYVTIPRIPASSLPQNIRYAQCVAAIRGEKVPEERDGTYARASLIRGIRCHFSFAESQAVKDICATCPEFARARNARLIMSNVIPGPEDMTDSNKTRQPYCIWHPDLATEETYRQLAQRFPSMRYQVGRACAAAGYFALFNELDLLPEVSIAEEARESSTAGGRLIYNIIMATTCRYAVFDDYNLSINLETPKSPAYLNGDTEVRWKLQKRYPLPENLTRSRWHHNYGPSIEEDRCVDVKGAYWPRAYDYLTHEESQLLYNPLPPDLPIVKKNLLIHMAAHEGNVDRYARLARPLEMDTIEELCVVRGIYHHTMFARFWLAEFEKNSLRVQKLDSKTIRNIRSSISARRIMTNDTQEFYKGWPEGVPTPTLFWWPLKPHENTLYELLEKVPRMKRLIAIAAIFCDYKELYQQINHPIDNDIVLAALNSRNPFYLSDLERKAAETGTEIPRHIYDVSQGDDYGYFNYDMEPTEKNLDSDLLDGLKLLHDVDCGHGPYGCFGGQANAGPAERYVWASLGLLRKLNAYCGGSTYYPTGEVEDMVEPESDASSSTSEESGMRLGFE